ncbi:MAG: hypothetical protein RLN60_00245 [Phycisphaerales bacterium]
MINPTADAVRAIAEHRSTYLGEPAHRRPAPDEVGVSLLAERLLAAARIAATLHAQAAGVGAQPAHGAGS